MSGNFEFEAFLLLNSALSFLTGTKPNWLCGRLLPEKADDLSTGILKRLFFKSSCCVYKLNVVGSEVLKGLNSEVFFNFSSLLT